MLLFDEVHFYNISFKFLLFDKMDNGMYLVDLDNGKVMAVWQET